MPHRIVLRVINDHYETLSDKVVNYFGFVATTGSITAGAYNETYTSKMFTPELWTIPDVAAIVGMFGVVSMVLKNGVDIWLSIQREKRLKRQKVEANDDSNQG